MAKKARKAAKKARPGIRKRMKQTGSSDKRVDRMIVALPPGMRMSKNGTLYVETRANRSDNSRKKRI